jgi:tetratricopeptide (TPR) repeat protein
LKKSPKVRPKPSPSAQNQPPTKLASRLDLWICIGLLIAIFAVYAQVATHAFINFDDPIYVTENPQVRAGLTSDGVVWAFTTFHDSNWFPLTWLSHMLDVQLFGLDSGWHHLINVLLHALSTLLLFIVLRRITGARWPSAFVALVFAIHPLHVESVAWIAERKDVLSTLFWMLTLLAYSNYVRQPTRQRYLLTLFIFCLGLMAKPMLVTLPVVLILLDLWPLRRGVRLVEKIPFFIASLASSVIAFVAHQQGGAVATLEVIPVASRIENALITYVVYILKTFWPTHLAIFYPYPLQSLIVPAILSAIALSVITVLVVLAYKQRPYLAVGWFWYVVTLLPVIGIIQTGSQARADRYTYIPMIGFTIALTWAAVDLLKPWHRMLAALAAFAGLALLTLTWFQVATWRDDISLYRHAIAAVPGNYIAYYNLASALEAQGQTDEAVIQLREAVRARPYYVPARAELGQLLAAQGHTDEALQELQAAIRLRPDDPIAHYRLGSVLGSLGRANEAASEFAETVRLQPNNPDAHYNLALALAQQDHIADAAREFAATIGLRPDDADAHFNLGISLARLGQLDGAIQQFNETLRLRPDYAPARQALDQATSLKQSPPNDK